METIKAIKTRRSVRSWLNKDISDEHLLTILESGRYSPSPLNSQPWHFIVIKKKDSLSNLTDSARYGTYLTNANILIVVTVTKNNYMDPWLQHLMQYEYSAACAVQNMWLTAWDLGLGACWVTIDELAARKILEIPQDQLILGSLALGYSEGIVEPHTDTDRKPLSEIVFKEKFGAK